MSTSSLTRGWAPLILVVLLAFAAIARVLWMDREDDGPQVTIYAGRSEELIQPILAQFEAETGIRVRVRYGQTAEMAATILEEGRRSPADLFFAQDAGALGALAEAGRLAPLPPATLERVDPRFRSTDGHWVGISGRARVLIFDPDRIDPNRVPDRLADLSEPSWRGRVGWAPPNGSFQAFVTAMRVTEGEGVARDWLISMRDNQARSYARNTAIVMAVAAGEIDVGLVNHYYLHAIQQERGAVFRLQNHYPAEGVLINIAGAGILDSAGQPEAAQQLIDFLLLETAQRYFTDQTFEYPLAAGVAPSAALPSLDDIVTPRFDLGQLHELDATLRLLQEIGLL